MNLSLLLLFVSSSAIIATSVASVQCGIQAPNLQPTPKSRNRIVGGTEAVPHSWPWLARALYSPTPTEFHQCGANLIRVSDTAEESDIVITAGHCVSKGDVNGYPIAHPPATLEINFGVHQGSAQTQFKQARIAAQTRIHPDLRDFGGHIINDIAVIKLNQTVKFTDGVRPICLPTAGEPIPVGKTCAVAGWGVFQDGAYQLSRVLKQLYVPVQDAQTCLRGNKFYDEKQLICAGGLYDQDNESTCRGDSGGMLACKDKADDPWVLYGTVSYGTFRCVGHKDNPTKFVRVSSYVDFINDAVKSLTAVRG